MNGSVRIGILNISDRASRGEYADLPGQAVKAILGEWITTPHEFLYEIIPDEQEVIAGHLREMALEKGCSLILTTGGTGPAARDVTTEATLEVGEKEYPGFGEAMRAKSLLKVPTAILSRQTAVSLGSCLIVNLPGSPRAGKECLEVVFPAIPCCIEILGGPRIDTDPQKMECYRPPNS
ncbi:MAG: molybdopterin adenylyltransferase [Puniceicoccaceae bacterium]